MITLTKKTLKEALGIDNDADLARWFQISQSAVCQWPEEEDIPRQRALEAAVRRPDLFQAVVDDSNESARAA